jgi:drug/metabolite transporter (DMT)-like permease
LKRVYGLLVVLLILWSSNFIFAKYALREFTVDMAIALRYVVSAACMVPVILAARRSSSWQSYRIRWSDAPWLLTVGLLGLVGNQVLFLVGLSMTSVAHASVITALSPVLVLVGAFLTGIERVTPTRIAGLAIAASGVVVLQFSRNATGEATAAGDGVMLLSVLLFAAFNLLGKPLAERYGSLKLNASTYMAAGVLALPVVIYRWADNSHAGALAWIGVVYMAAASSVLGYLIYGYALQRLPASRVAVVIYLQPLLASLLAVALLGERPTAGFIPAAALVLGGVYTVQRS